MTTAFTQLVGCELPIQQAPVGFSAAVPELPIAVAAAGGHGMLAGVRMTPADLIDRLDRIGAHTRAYGVNLIAPIAGPEELEAAAHHAGEAEHDISVGDRRLDAAAAIGGRPRDGANRPRPNPQRPDVVDPRN
jgi:NAD(P)H-dependent flavin oxidoreductase YrpB (nitropropane dioxygenase family)